MTFSFANVALDGETKLAAGTTITAANGQQVPSSILYTDAAGGKTNYLPIRAISELLGVEIGYDSATKTVLLGEQGLPAAEKHWKGRWTARALPTPAKGPKRPIPYRLSGALPGCRRGGSCRETFHSTTQAKYRFTGDGGHVSFICAYPDKASIGSTVRHEQTIQNCQQVAVQGYPADLYTEKDGWTYLVWEGEDGILFWFSGTGISTEDLTRMAESVRPDTEQLPGIGWAGCQQGYQEFERTVLGSAVQETWLGRDASVTLLYAAGPVELPEGKRRL